MATLIVNNNKISLKDGDSISPSCEVAGLAFNCHTGVCASCLVEVREGGQNLSPLTQEEKTLGLDAHRRLACQCCILKGTVKIGF